MGDGLTRALAALDARAAPLDVFLRDDDAGWDDARLSALLDCVARAGVPVDLAVIPQACGDSLARELRARCDAAPGAIGLHQHGCAHVDHEASGRKCEFGPARDAHSQRRDLAAGRARLIDRFGHRLDAIFTPPWNRCAPTTSALLAELGFVALSRDRGAPAQRDLPELPVDIDWCKLRRQSPDGASIAAALAGRARHDEPAGLMLHHAQMDDGDLALLGRLLGILARHPRVRFRSMRALVAVTAAVA